MMALTITLSPTASVIVQSRIDHGGYKDAQSVIEAALTESETDDEIEHWLTHVVAPTYDAFKADPSQVLSSEGLRSRLNSFMESRAKKSA
jgi:antitoxin ParD1/3/4